MKEPSKLNISVGLFLPPIISILLQFFPLTNTFGFEYSMIMSLPLFISGGLIAFNNSDLFRDSTAFILVASVPFILAFLANLLFSPCPLSTDILFYFVISLPALFFGYVTALVINKVFKRYQRVFFFISFFLILSISLIEFYLLPQIYFYNLIFGYFPGTIYDELIEISSQLLVYRILNVLIFLLIFYMLRRGYNKKQIVFGIIFSVIVWFGILKENLSFITTEEIIEQHLTKEIETEHFQIFTDPDIYFNEESLSSMHEFYFDEITEMLALSDSVKIKSYIFKDRQQKKELFGAGNADVAKPWLNQIYLDEESFQNTLKHELVHVLSAEFGVTPFKVAAYINPAIIEGLAMAIENEYGGHTIDYPVKLAQEYGYSISLFDLFSGLNFFTNTSSLSYLYSGSFIKYLIEKYGVEKLKKFYKSAEFEDVYDEKLAEVEADFKAYLNSLNYPINKETAHLYFGRKPLIKKICPRYAARLQKEANDLYRQSNFEDALSKYKTIYNYSDSYSALVGIIQSNIRLNKYEEAKRIIYENFSKYKNTSYFYDLELRAINISILNSDSLAAVNYADQLIEQKPSKGYLFEALFRKHLIDHGLVLANNYLFESVENKYEIIRSIVEEGEKPILYIDNLIDDSITLKRADELLKELPEFQIDKSELDSFVAAKISRMAFRMNKLDAAAEYAKIALENNKEDFSTKPLKENLKLVNWKIKN